MNQEFEGTQRMKKNFLLHHDEGFSVAEIARKYDLSVKTVYDSLQEIADNNGVEREDLLQRPHKPRESYNKASKKYVTFYGAESLLEDFEQGILRVKETLDHVQVIMEDVQ